MSDYKLTKETAYLFGDRPKLLESIKTVDDELGFLKENLLAMQGAKEVFQGKALHIKNAIIELIKQNSQGPYKTEGTNTYHLPDGSQLKTVEKVNYPVDKNNLAELMQTIPLERLPIRVSYSLDKKAYAALEHTDPEAYTMMRELHVIKPKPANGTSVIVKDED
jgi:hypothetical protein